jgi:hypothetical protein
MTWTLIALSVKEELRNGFYHLYLGTIFVLSRFLWLGYNTDQKALRFWCCYFGMRFHKRFWFFSSPRPTSCVDVYVD